MVRGAPKNLGVSYNISETAEASDFKFGTQLGFAKAHHKITPRGKSGCGLELGSSPKFWGFPIIFLQRLKLATSNLECSWDLPRPTIKSHPEEKLAWRLAREGPKNWGSLFYFCNGCDVLLALAELLVPICRRDWVYITLRPCSGPRYLGNSKNYIYC